MNPRNTITKLNTRRDKIELQIQKLNVELKLKELDLVEVCREIKNKKKLMWV